MTGVAMGYTVLRHIDQQPRTLRDGQLIRYTRAYSLRESFCCSNLWLLTWGATAAEAGVSELEAVSIHAPAWGATCTGSRKPAVIVVSIHAPRVGNRNRPSSLGDDPRRTPRRPKVGSSQWQFRRAPPKEPAQAALPLIHSPAVKPEGIVWDARREIE